MYKVIKAFTDLQSQHVYSVGDVFPHNGVEVDKKRVDELAGNKNKMGTPLIAEVEKPKRKRESKKVEETEEE